MSQRGENDLVLYSRAAVGNNFDYSMILLLSPEA